MFRISSSFRNNVAMYLLSDDVSATKRHNFSCHQQASGIGTEDPTFPTETGLLDLSKPYRMLLFFILLPLYLTVGRSFVGLLLLLKKRQVT